MKSLLFNPFNFGWMLACMKNIGYYQTFICDFKNNFVTPF